MDNDTEKHLVQISTCYVETKSKMYMDDGNEIKKTLQIKT